MGLDSKDRVRVAVVGCGGIACQYHLRILSAAPEVALVGVADPSREARVRAAALAGVPASADCGELIERDDVDAVVVCAANEAHGELALAVAEAGKHLYLEKPVAVSVEEGRRAVAAAQAAGIVAAMGFNFRFLPLYREARRRLSEGVIGRVVAVRTRFSEPVVAERMPAWKRRRDSGGGALLDLGSHHIDLLRWMFDDELARIEAARIESDRSEHDFVSFSARTSGDTAVEAEFSYRGGRVCSWEIQGEEGRLLLDRIGGSARVVADGGRASRGPRAALRARIRALPIPRREPTFGLALGAFTARLQQGGGELPGLGDGLRSLEVALDVESEAGVA